MVHILSTWYKAVTSFAARSFCHQKFAMHVVQLLLNAWEFSRDKIAIEVYIVRSALSSLGGARYIKVYASSGLKAAAEQAQAGKHLYSAQLRNIWHPSQTQVTTNMVDAKSSMELGPPVHMPTAPYEYRALTRRSSIRLVEIEPGLPGQPLKCSVRESDLESGQSFRALSYVWGEKRSQRSIFVKAADRSDPELAQLDVTPNLWDALQTLREAPPSAAPLTIWVDAICINQDDVEERSHQVAMMRETYAHASCVEVWLGHADQDTAYVVKLAQAIRQYVPDVHMQAVRRSNHMGAIKSMLGLQSLPSWPVDWIRAAEDLFASRTWFERVWVIQEVSAGSPVGVRIGDHRLSWDEVGLMAMWLREARWSATASAEGSEHLRNAVQMWQERFNRNERVPDLLDDARDFQATDARDKIHALL